MKPTDCRQGLALLCLGLLLGCGDTKPSRVPETVAIAGNRALAVGQTSQLTATVTFTNGETENVTAAATWRSLNEAVATVAAGGMATARTNGTAQITAQYQAVTGTINVDVGSPIIAPIAQTVAIAGNQALVVGQTSQLTATVTFTDGTTENVTAAATWRSLNEAVATVAAGGMVTARANGASQITAQYQSVTGTINVDVGPAILAQVTMTQVQVKLSNPAAVAPPVNAGQCLLLNAPQDAEYVHPPGLTGPGNDPASHNVVKCRFDASTSISKTNIVTYSWSLQIGTMPQRRELGTYSGVTVTSPVYRGCGILPITPDPAAAIPAFMQLTITAADGSKDTREHPFTFVRYGAC